MFKQNLKKPKILSTDINTSKQPNSSNQLQALQFQTPNHTHLHKKGKQKHNNQKQFIKYFPNGFQQRQKISSSKNQIQNDFNSLNKKINDKLHSQELEYDSTAPQFSKIYIKKKCNELIQNYKKSRSRQREQYDDELKNKIYDNELNQKLINCRSQNLFFTKKSRVQQQNKEQIKNRLKQMEFKYLQLQQKYKNVLIEAKKHVSLFQIQKFRLQQLKQNHFSDQNQLQNLRQKLFSKKVKHKFEIKTSQEAVQVVQSQFFNQNLNKKSRLNFKKQNNILSNWQEKSQKSVQHLHTTHLIQVQQQKLFKLNHVQKQKHKSQMNWFQIQKKCLIQQSKAKHERATTSTHKCLEAVNKMKLSRSIKKIDQKNLSISQLHSKSVKDLRKSRSKQQNQLSSVKRDIFNVKQHIQNLQRFKKNSANATNNLIKMREKRKNRQEQFQKDKISSKINTLNQDYIREQNYIKEYQKKSNNNLKYSKMNKREFQPQDQEQQRKEKILETPIAKLLVKKSVNQNLMASKYKFKPSVNI